MAYTQVPTRSSSDPNASADINQLQLNTEQSRLSKSVSIIDGDFNVNSTGSTSQSADGYDVFDMWRFVLQGGTGSLSQQSHAGTNSKPYFARINMNTSTAFGRIEQRLKGNRWSGKTLSAFLRLKYVTNEPTSISCSIVDNAGTPKGQGSVSSFTTDWAWYRIDFTVSSFTTANFSYFELINNNTETWDLDIDKIRLIETNNLPTGVIPEWIKEDEDLETSRSLSLQYYQQSYEYGTAPATATQASQRASSGSAAGATTGYIFDQHYLHVPMVQPPTMSYYDRLGNATKCDRGTPGVAPSNNQALSSVFGYPTSKAISVESSTGGSGSVIFYHYVADARY
jgi:hypothetical protein